MGGTRISNENPGRERRCERASRLATEREDVRELRSGRVRSDVFERDLGVLEVVEKDVRVGARITTKSLS